MSTDCGHLLCELIGGSCSLSSGMSRGCRTGFLRRNLDPAIFDEVRSLLSVIDPNAPDDQAKSAAVRLAAIIRREARDDRNLVSLARTEEPDLAPALAALCARRR